MIFFTNLKSISFENKIEELESILCYHYTEIKGLTENPIVKTFIVMNERQASNVMKKNPSIAEQYYILLKFADSIDIVYKKEVINFLDISKKNNYKYTKYLTDEAIDNQNIYSNKRNQNTFDFIKFYENQSNPNNLSIKEDELVKGFIELKKFTNDQNIMGFITQKKENIESYIYTYPDKATNIEVTLRGVEKKMNNFKKEIKIFIANIKKSNFKIENQNTLEMINNYETVLSKLENASQYYFTTFKNYFEELKKVNNQLNEIKALSFKVGNNICIKVDGPENSYVLLSFELIEKKEHAIRGFITKIVVYDEWKGEHSVNNCEINNKEYFKREYHYFSDNLFGLMFKCN